MVQVCKRVTHSPGHLQSNFYNYNSLTEAFSSIIKNDGVRGLFAGYGATFIRDAPFAGIYLFFYEHFKSAANGKG